MHGCFCFPQSRSKKKSPEQRRLNILLTNGRFPVTLDLARQLYLANHHVYVVDPMHYHVGFFSKAVDGSTKVPAPSIDPEGYIQGVRKAVEKNHIDLIIPLHEEILYLTQCTDEEILKRLFAPRWDNIIRLHNKWSFSKLLPSLGLDVPEAHLIRTYADVKALDRSKEWALKPCYGRASTSVFHLKPNEDLPKPEEVGLADTNHYIAQEWLKGKRYCSYGVFREGQMQAFALYPVLDTIDGSSSVYFEAMEHEGVRRYVSQVAEKLNITGQLAFDFVETDEGRLCSIECNPRATSGIHLWTRTSDLGHILAGTYDRMHSKRFAAPRTHPHKPSDSSADSSPAALENNAAGTNSNGHAFEPLSVKQKRQGKFGFERPPAKAQVAPGMLMWEHSKATPGAWLRHMRRLVGTKDVMWSWTDPGPSLMQPLLLTSYFEICRERKLDLPTMFQADLVWDLDVVLKWVKEQKGRVREIPDLEGEQGADGEKGNETQDVQRQRAVAAREAGDDHGFLPNGNQE